MKRPKQHVIQDLAQLEAICAPLRQELVSAAEELEEFTVKDLAERLGRPATTIYYHLSKLVEVGLVLEAGSRTAHTKHETLFALVAKQVFIDRENRDPAYLAVLAKTARSVFSLADRTFQRALNSPSARLAGPGANLQLRQRSARLSKPDLRRLAAMLAEVEAFLKERNDPDQQHSFLVTASYARLGGDE